MCTYESQVQQSSHSCLTLSRAQYYSQCLANETRLVPYDSCQTDDDCAGTQVCVVESPSYTQCVECSTFESHCQYWSEAFLAAALLKCAIAHCGDRCPNHVDTDCDENKTCVIQVRTSPARVVA